MTHHDLGNRQRVAHARNLTLTCWVIRFNPRPLAWWERILVTLHTRPAPIARYLTAIAMPEAQTVWSTDITDAAKFPTFIEAEDFRWAKLITDPDFTRLQAVSATIAGMR